MRHQLLPIAGALLLLAGCTGQSPGFEHLYQLAMANNADAQVELAHAYLDPARFPDVGPVQPDLVEAVKWCTIAWSNNAALAGPACGDVLAAVPPGAYFEGLAAAQQWLTAPMDTHHY